MSVCLGNGHNFRPLRAPTASGKTNKGVIFSLWDGADRLLKDNIVPGENDQNL